MATLLFLGPKIEGERDTYRVQEDLGAVVGALQGAERFVAFTDPGDGEPVWFRVEAIRYCFAD